MGSSRISVFGEDGTLGLAFVRYGVGLIVEFEARLVMHPSRVLLLRRGPD